MSNKIKWGVLGGGGDSLIGVLHRVAANMFDAYQLTGGVFNPDKEVSLKFAEEIGIPTNRIYENLDEMISEEMKLSWNGLMLKGYVDAYKAFQENTYLEA